MRHWGGASGGAAPSNANACEDCRHNHAALHQLGDEVSELRKLTVGIIEPVSRNEGEIDVIREQIQTADKPSPLD